MNVVIDPNLYTLLTCTVNTENCPICFETIHREQWVRQCYVCKGIWHDNCHVKMHNINCPLCRNYQIYAKKVVALDR